MTDQPYTPTTEQIELLVLGQLKQSAEKRGLPVDVEADRADFRHWLAGIKMTERLFMLAQIMDVADFDPGQKDEYGRIEIPAYTVIDVHELNEIARLEGHEFMAITVEDLEKHASMIEAAAERRGAEPFINMIERVAEHPSLIGTQTAQDTKQLLDSIQANHTEGDE